MPKEDNVEEIRQHIKMKEMNQLLMRKMIHQVNKTVSNNRKHIHHPRRLRMKPIKIKTLQKITILIKIEVKKITTFLKITNLDRKSTRLNSSHVSISYAVFCLKKKIADTGRNTKHPVH